LHLAETMQMIIRQIICTITVETTAIARLPILRRE
jgi:hypothetical protein